MLLPTHALLLPPGCRVCPAARQQTVPIARSVAGAVPNRLHRGAVQLQAKKRATGSEDPTPAPASRKGRKKKTEVDAAAEAAAEAAAAEAAEAEAAEAEAAAAASEDAALANWVDSGVDSGGSPEEDRRRFPYHRRLQAAASDGNIEAAESAFSGMEAAGLAPGPRAFHVLLCAHLKGGDTPGALGVTGRATEAGVQLLPESYAVLIYAAMESVTPPDLEVAKALFSALSSTGTDRQLPWATLARLLAGKGFGAEAVATVREGLREGLVLDADVAAAYLKGLCDTGQLDGALALLEGLAPRYGIKPEARHVAVVVGGLARAGNFDDASSLLDAAGNRGWGRSAASFNALLSAIVADLENDDEEGTLAFSLAKMTGRMVQSGVRPNKFTFKHEAEGYIKLGDPRTTMGSLKSLRSAAGTGGLRLLEGGALSVLLQLLSAKDMPVDMLQLLVYMAEDGCRMPAGALVPDAAGVTPLDGWLSGHLEGMAARADMRSAEADMLKAPIEYVNGVPLGPGLCVVDEGGSIVPVAKATVKELRAEAEARQIVGAKDMKRPELAAAIKAARARLPFNVLQAQVSTAGEGIRGGSKKKAAAGAGGARKAKRKTPAREVWVISEEGDLNIVAAPPDSAFLTESEKFLLSESALDELDLTDDQYALSSNKNKKEIDFDALLEARMLDEGTAAVMNVGDEDVVSGFATLLPGAEGDDEGPDADDEDESKGGAELDEEAWRKMQSFEARSIDPQTLQEGYRQLQFLEAQQIDTDEANLVAGMDIAMDILRAAETVGGGASPADLLLLTSGALAERNVNAAADIARRLSLLLSPEAAAASSTAQPESYDPAFVLQQYESLAEMCLSQRAVQQADVVLESAEVAGLQPSAAVLAKLTAALRGQPRRGERLGRENAALLERAGVDDLGDLALTNTDTLQQQQQLADSTSAAAAGGGPPAPEVTVEALSVRDTPVQQQHQEAEDEELPPELQDMADALQGVAEWEERQQEMGQALSKLGLDAEAISDVLAQPAALMADSSWVTAALLSILQEPDEDDLEGEGQQQQQGEAWDGEQQQQQQQQRRAAARAAKSIDDMSLAELAKACATDSLTPEQSDALVGMFEEAGLPLLYDEVDRRILWPGSPEYEDWAGDNPAEAAEDQECFAAALAEEFAPELQQAGEAAEAVSAALEAEGGLSALEARLAAAAAGGVEEPEVEQFLSLKQEFHEALQEMGLMPSSEQQEEAGAAGEEATALAFDGSREEREELMQELQQQLELLIDARQDELRAAYKQLGLGEPDLSLGGGSSSGSGGGSKDDDGSGSDSSRRKQLTGR